MASLRSLELSWLEGRAILGRAWILYFTYVILTQSFHFTASTLLSSHRCPDAFWDKWAFLTVVQGQEVWPAEKLRVYSYKAWAKKVGQA